MFHLKLKIVAFIFVCEVMLWIEWLCSHVGRLVAAGIDSLREQKNVTFHSCELLSNHIPSKEEIYCLLLGGIICKYFPFTMFRLKLDAIIFVCEVMLLIEALRSHVAMLVAAEMDSLRKQRSVKIDSHELVSNLIPSKKEGMYCPLLEGFTDRKSAENEKQRSETTGNTKLSDDTSCREVQTDSESESQLYEEGARRTVDEAVIFDWRSHEGKEWVKPTNVFQAAARQLAARHDPFWENWEMEVDLTDVFSNLMPLKNDNKCLTPDRVLRGSTDQNGAEDNTQSLQINGNTQLSHGTSSTEVKTDFSYLAPDKMLFRGFFMGSIMPFHPGRASRKGKKNQRKKIRRRPRKRSEGPVPMDWEPL